MRVVVGIVALLGAATACQASVTVDGLDAPDAVTAFIILSNPDPAAFDDALAEAQRRASASDIVLTVDVANCDITRGAAFPQPDSVNVRLYSRPIDCAVAVNYRALFVLPAAGTNDYGSWRYDGTPNTEIEVVELDR